MGSELLCVFCEIAALGLAGSKTGMLAHACSVANIIALQFYNLEKAS
jgi:hypothetical protein